AVVGLVVGAERGGPGGRVDRGVARQRGGGERVVAGVGAGEREAGAGHGLGRRVVRAVVGDVLVGEARRAAAQADGVARDLAVERAGGARRRGRVGVAVVGRRGRAGHARRGGRALAASGQHRV